MKKQEENQNEFIDIRPVIKKGIRYWYVFIISTFICVSLGGVYFLLAKPKFQILANILIKENENGGMSGMQAMMMNNTAFGSLLGGNTSINDELQLLSSFSVFRETVKDLSLNESYEVKKFPFNQKCYHDSPIKIIPETAIADTLSRVIKFNVKIGKTGSGTIKAQLGLWKSIGKISFEKLPVTLQTSYGNFNINTTSFYIPGENYNIKAIYSGYNWVSEKLQELVTIDLVSKKANVINLSTIEQNRKKGKDILNTLIQVYNQSGIKQKNTLASNTISFLDERINLIANELSDIEKEIEIYKKENSLTDIETEAKIILEKSGDFKERLIDAETQYTVIELVENFLLKPENRYSLVPLNIGLSDRTVLEGLQKYNEALLERLKLMKNTYIDNPTVTTINEQIDVMRDNMLATIRSLKSGFMYAREDLKKQEDYFISRIKGMPTQEREFANIKRQQAIKQELFLFLLQKKEENNLTLSITTPNAQIIDSAYYKSEPVAPNLKIVLLLSLFFGGALGGGYISLTKYIHNLCNKNNNDKKEKAY